MWKGSARDQFCYLKLIIHDNEEIEEEVTIRIKTGWLKRPNGWGALCNRRIPTKLKGQFCKTTIRPTWSTDWVLAVQKLSL